MDLSVEPAESHAKPKTVIDHVYYYFAAASMIALVCCVIYVVTSRYFFNSPPIWGEDVPRIIFIWGMFLSAPLAIKQGLNIRVTSVDTQLSPEVLRWLKIVLHLIVLVLLATIFVNAWPLIKLALRGTMLSTGWSNAVLRLPVMIGTALMFIAQTQLLISVIRRTKP